MSARRPPQGTASITDFTVEENVADGVFRWAPPLIERSPRPKALYLNWRALQVVFPDLADPRSFALLPTWPSDDDRELYDRYIAAAEELAESELLCGDDSMRVRWDRESGESVEASFTSKEITRGFATLLRQFDSKDEDASFQRVSGRLRRAAANAGDASINVRCAQIDAWRTAQGVLHGTELSRLGRRAVAPALEYGNEHPPTYYLSLFNYGDLIHWGSKRDVHAKSQDDDHTRAHDRMAFLEAASGLSLLYLGFSELIRTSIGHGAVRLG